MMPLDRNESYWLLDDDLVEATHAIGACELSTYPDYVGLKAVLAKYAGVAPENILPTSGSVAAIEHVARAYAGREVVLPVPTFYYYETILDRMKAKIVPITYEERDGQFIFPLAKTLEALKSNTAKVLFLCHPNNPLGSSLSSEDIATIATVARGSDTLIVSDEAYFEFSSGTSFLPYLAELPNLIIIRTLSKAFALSGARIGYVIAAPERLKEIENVMLPWTVTYPSVTAALALLARADEVKVRREAIISAREHFIEALHAVGIEAYPSETNFVLVRVPDASRIAQELLTQDIRVALGSHMSRFDGARELLTNTLRIAIPSPKDEVSFIHALQKTLR